jgi:class 3 adenylate cyclase/tetratricopeptide (TPR) repeat protein
MRTIFILFCTTCFLVTSGFAQKRGQERIDSLLLDHKPSHVDTQQAKVLIDLSFTYNTIDPDKGIEFGKQGLAMSQKLKYKPGEIDAYRALGVNYGFGKSAFPDALIEFGKSLALCEETGNQVDAAKALNNMGVIHWFLSDFQKALEYYFKALDIHEAMNKRDEIAITLTNIGLVYNSQKDYPKALEYVLKGNAIDEELDNKPGIASNLGNIGEIYKRLNDYPKALEYNNKALALYESLGDKNGIARNLGNIGGIYKEQGLYQQALDNHFKALALDKEMGLQIGMAANLGSIGGIYLELAKDPNQEALNTLFQGDQKRALQQAKIYVDSSITIAKEIEDINMLISLYEGMSEIQTLSGDYRGALESYKLSAISSDSVFNMEKNKKLTEAAMQYEFDKKEAKSRAEQEQKDIRQRAIRNSIIAGLVGSLIFLGVVIRQRIRIGREKKISDTEKRRSDELLLNILPEEVAEELKATGTAKAKAFTMVTVMMTDFKDFTTISEKISAELLVAEIHYCFSAFDEIIQKYKIEKIKTIGDAYLCASGLPVSNYSHAAEIVQAAIEIRDFMERRKVEKEALGEIPFDIRIGIHTGPVVAGIVGVKKYAYDIWGDTVNLAARMEQNSDAGKINISQNTYELVKEKFDCTYRGKIEAKNKGMVSMYFAEPFPNA